MSVVLGRWPIIPDQQSTVSLPREALGSETLPSDGDENVPSIFCERKLQIQLSTIAAELLSTNNGKPSTDPATISMHIERLNFELIDKLPPAFRFHDTDEKWDDKLPHLKRQREMFRISVFATMCMLLRPMVIMPASQNNALSASDKALVAKHKESLADAAMEMLNSVGKLHTLMGGKQNRFFLLSFFTLEPAALLGIYLLSSNIDSRLGRQNGCRSATRDQERWQQGRKAMEESVTRLRLLSEVSSIARTGLKVLTKLFSKIEEMESIHSSRGAATTSSKTGPTQSKQPSSPSSIIQNSNRSSRTSESSQESSRLSISQFPLPIFDPNAVTDDFSDHFATHRVSPASSASLDGSLNFNAPSDWTNPNAYSLDMLQQTRFIFVICL